ncbi:MAG: hypothetical protein JNL38_27445 [Myxococcales bacterium]|nr:hypothetical protein [Myxococcales bacterium]
MALFPNPEGTVTVPSSEQHVCRPILDAAQAREHVRRAVLDGVFKPTDIEKSSRIGELTLLWAPFWRVDVSVDGFHFGFAGTATVGRSGMRVPIPTGGARHKDAVVMVSARKVFPYEAKLPAWLSGTFDGVAPLEVNSGELAPRSDSDLRGGEIVLPDTAKGDAEAIAAKMVVRAVHPGNALYAKYEPQIRSSLFCWYPVYHAVYDYDGAARRHQGERFFVTVSARTGKPVSAHHPSAVRAAAAKLRKLISFGMG